MASIRSQLQLMDGMSPVLRKISGALELVLDNFEQVQRASGNSIDVARIEAARSALVGCNADLDRMEENLRNAAQGQGRVNSQMQRGGGFADALASKIARIAGAVGGVAAAVKAVQLSDKLIGAEARLELIVDDGGSVEALQNRIFASAQASRGDYVETMQTISKLGVLAGDAFTSNDEMIRFSELMNKNFVIAGASASERSNSMYQLTQAMASGRLQGDEFRSIRENAPLLAQSIEEYMEASGVPGTMKEWAAEGMITGEAIKAALFTSADQIDERFNDIPMRWTDIWTSMKNEAVRAFGPVLARINEFANDPGMQSFLAGVTDGFHVAAGAVLGLLNGAAAVAGFFQENWAIIAPIIWGVVAALVAYNAVMGIGWLTTLKSLGAKVAHAIASAAETAAIIALTAAQNGLNAALALCPITWIIVAIVALIAIFYAAVAAVNKFAGTSVSATGIIAGSIAVAGAFIGNIVLGLVNTVIGLGVELWNLIAVFANFFANIFNDPVGAIVNLFAGMFDFILGIVQAAAKLIDTVFGSDFSGAVEGFRSNVADKVQEIVGDQVEVMPKLNAEDFQFDMIDYGGAWDAGYSFGEGLEGKAGGLFNFDGLGGGTDFEPDWTGIGNDVAATAANTGKTADTLDEDLKYLRDVAEQEAINRFTTAEVKIDMTGMTNRIDSSMDIDGVISRLTDGFTEAVLVAAEGVHA